MRAPRLASFLQGTPRSMKEPSHQTCREQPTQGPEGLGARPGPRLEQGWGAVSRLLNLLRAQRLQPPQSNLLVLRRIPLHCYCWGIHTHSDERCIGVLQSGKEVSGRPTPLGRLSVKTL